MHLYVLVMDKKYLILAQAEKICFNDYYGVDGDLSLEQFLNVLPQSERYSLNIN